MVWRLLRRTASVFSFFAHIAVSSFFNRKVRNELRKGHKEKSQEKIGRTMTRLSRGRLIRVYQCSSSG